MSGVDFIVFEDADRGTSEPVPRAEVPESVAFCVVDGARVAVARTVKRSVQGRIFIEAFDAEGRLLQRVVGAASRDVGE